MTSRKPLPNSNVDDKIAMLRKMQKQVEARNLLMKILLEHPEKRTLIDEELWKKKTNPSKRKNE
jgi:hypothetical protein